MGHTPVDPMLHKGYAAATVSVSLPIPNDDIVATMGSFMGIDKMHFCQGQTGTPFTRSIKITLNSCYHSPKPLIVQWMALVYLCTSDISAHILVVDVDWWCSCICICVQYGPSLELVLPSGSKFVLGAFWIYLRLYFHVVKQCPITSLSHKMHFNAVCKECPCSLFCMT